MAHPFELSDDLEIAATPEQVWDAISTGAGLDSWFMGHTEFERRQGGAVRWSIGAHTEGSTVTTWDPPRHLVTVTPERPDGAYHRFDYRIDARPSGSTFRYIHSGMLGDDWEAEYEGMSEGDPMYFDKLVQYLTYFRGRHAVGVDGMGPRVDDKASAFVTFRRGLGIAQQADLGDRVHLRPEGIEPDEGVIDYVSPSFLGVRSDDALYRFMHGYEGSTFIGHHLFGDGVDQAAASEAWGAWLTRLFAPPE